MKKCIDFDKHFKSFISSWTEKHAGEYKNYDDMEADIPNIYSNFLNTPARWLDGVTPGSYFTQFEDPKDLVDWLNDYCMRGVSVPDLLLEQIEFVGKPCEKRLLALLKDGESNQEAKMIAITLLREMGSDQPKMLYIAMQENRSEKDELADNALESLAEMGKCALQPMLEAVPRSNKYGQEALLDVLVNYPGNEQIFKLALRLFKENSDRCALFASYLGKLGDDRALPDLIDAAKDDRTGYVDYIELRCAIEELGGICPDREFDSDPAYDALNGLN